MKDIEKNELEFNELEFKMLQNGYWYEEEKKKNFWLKVFLYTFIFVIINLMFVIGCLIYELDKLGWSLGQ